MGNFHGCSSFTTMRFCSDWHSRNCHVVSMHPFLMPKSFESQKTSNNKKTGPATGGCNLPSKKKQLWLTLGSSWIIFSPNPLRGPYTAAIGTMCYQFQSDTPGVFSRQVHQGTNPPGLDNKNEHKGGLGYLYHINCWLFQLCCPSKVASKRKKGWGSRIQKMLKSYLFRGGKCWYLSPATPKICWIILPGLP